MGGGEFRGVGCCCDTGECWFTGETDSGRVDVVGELEGGLARGLVLRLLLPTETELLEPGVTASKAEPKPGRL